MITAAQKSKVESRKAIMSRFYHTVRTVLLCDVTGCCADLLLLLNPILSHFLSNYSEGESEKRSDARTEDGHQDKEEEEREVEKLMGTQPDLAGYCHDADGTYYTSYSAERAGVD